jgi:hypothetical protein
MPELVPATKSDSSPYTKWKRRQERLVNVAGVVALTYVGLRIVGKIGAIMIVRSSRACMHRITVFVISVPLFRRDSVPEERETCASCPGHHLRKCESSM